MKKYRIHISIFGLILQILFLFLIIRRTGYWSDINQNFIIFSIAILLYNSLIDKKSTLKRYCIQYLAAITIAAVLSGLLAGFELLNIFWLLIFGAITGSLVITILYHTARLLIPEGVEEKGFSYFLEVGLTFFSCAVYPTFLYIPLTIVNSITLIMIIFIISLLVGFALTVPINKSMSIILNAIKEWQSINKLPSIQVTIINKFFAAFNNFFTQIKNSFNALENMGSEIKTSSKDLSSVSEQMNASLEEVSSTIQQIAKGAQEQSTSLTSIAHSIEGLNNLTSSISSQVKMASVSSRRTTNSAKHGMELSKKETKITNLIFEQTKFIEDKMTELRDQSTEIKKILDIIAGITEQTDLLALNAAIEAARVGEQGRGFAVVADEIRNLATETKHSSAVVENLILEINKTIQELSTLLTSEREKITESNELAARTDEQFTGIVKAVDLVTDMISRINQAAANQAENTKGLVKQVDQIAQVAADTASATEEVSASVQEQTASMQEFTSTAQILASFAVKLDELLSNMNK